MKKTNLNKFFAVLEFQPNGKLKIKIAKKYINVNQHLKYWQPTNARNLARMINKSNLIIK